MIDKPKTIFGHLANAIDPFVAKHLDARLLLDQIKTQYVHWRTFNREPCAIVVNDKDHELLRMYASDLCSHVINHDHVAFDKIHGLTVIPSACQPEGTIWMLGEMSE